MKVLAHFATLTEVPFYKLSFVAGEVPEARKQLLAAGMRAEERAIADAMLLAFDFHQKAGHRLVQNVDPEGSVLDVDDAGNLLDEHGNILATAEQGRASWPES
ncbi:hypothetical protein [Streptomyces sp. HC307]|uniref:hypothetical protein n=1 Tax=Streptomyces flavusporus TaxID=3385496 RepID=UPI003916EF22